MKKNLKSTLLSGYLRIVSLVQFLLWGVTHVFFPEWYLVHIAGKDPTLLTPQNLLMVNEIGVSVIAISVATWIAARDPVKHFPVILLNFIIGAGSIGVTLYHILVRQASQEWGHIFTVLVMLGIIAVLYPWKALVSIHAD